jgi:tetratricopeptide (TPR) repeat protein
MFSLLGRILVLVVTVTGVGLPLLSGAQPWLKASTEDVVIISNASRRAVSEYAVKYSAFRQTFIKLLAPAGKRPPPVVLILFQSPSDLAKYLAKPKDTSSTITVFRTEVDDLALLALADSGNREDALSMAFEFDTIWSLRRVGYFLPLWATQGTGEVLGSLRIKKDQCIIDGRLERVDSTWRRLPALPWTRFFDISESSPEYHGKDASGIYQAQAWALLNFILFQESKPRERFEALAGKIQAWKEGPRLVEEMVGVPTAKLEQAINRHLRQPQTVTIPFDEKAIFAGLKIESADDAEVKVRLSDILIASGRIYEGDRLVDQAVTVSSQSTLANEPLGRRALRANDLTGAAQYYRSAMSGGSVDTNAWLTSALSYLEQSQGFGRDLAGGGRKGVDTALAEIHRALELNPGDMRAWQILGRAYFVAEKPSEEGVGELTRAITDDESGQSIRYYRGLLYGRLGKTTEAIADFNAVMDNPKSSRQLQASAASLKNQFQTANDRQSTRR